MTDEGSSDVISFKKRGKKKIPIVDVANNSGQPQESVTTPSDDSGNIQKQTALPIIKSRTIVPSHILGVEDDELNDLPNLSVPVRPASIIVSTPASADVTGNRRPFDIEWSTEGPTNMSISAFKSHDGDDQIKVRKGDKAGDTTVTKEARRRDMRRTEKRGYYSTGVGMYSKGALDAMKKQRTYRLGGDKGDQDGENTHDSGSMNDEEETITMDDQQDVSKLEGIFEGSAEEIEEILKVKLQDNEGQDNGDGEMELSERITHGLYNRNTSCNNDQDRNDITYMPSSTATKMEEWEGRGKEAEVLRAMRRTKGLDGVVVGDAVGGDAAEVIDWQVDVAGNANESNDNMRGLKLSADEVAMLTGNYKGSRQRKGKSDDKDEYREEARGLSEVDSDSGTGDDDDENEDDDDVVLMDELDDKCDTNGMRRDTKHKAWDRGKLGNKPGNGDVGMGDLGSGVSGFARLDGPLSIVEKDRKRTRRAVLDALEIEEEKHAKLRKRKEKAQETGLNEQRRARLAMMLGDNSEEVMRVGSTSTVEPLDRAQIQTEEEEVEEEEERWEDEIIRRGVSADVAQKLRIARTKSQSTKDGRFGGQVNGQRGWSYEENDEGVEAMPNLASLNMNEGLANRSEKGSGAAIGGSQGGLRSASSSATSLLSRPSNRGAVSLIRKSIQDAVDKHQSHLNKLNSTFNRVESENSASSRALEKMIVTSNPLDDKYQFFQETRTYFTVLLALLQRKASQLHTLALKVAETRADRARTIWLKLREHENDRIEEVYGSVSSNGGSSSRNTHTPSDVILDLYRNILWFLPSTSPFFESCPCLYRRKGSSSSRDDDNHGNKSVDEFGRDVNMIALFEKRRRQQGRAAFIKKRLGASSGSSSDNSMGNSMLIGDSTNSHRGCSSADQLADLTKAFLHPEDNSLDLDGVSMELIQGEAHPMFPSHHDGAESKTTLSLSTFNPGTGYTHEIDMHLADISVAFDDVDEEYSDIETILHHFLIWKRQYSKSFIDAYVSLAIPHLIAPFVRQQLLVWSPFTTLRASLSITPQLPLNVMPSTFDSLPWFRALARFDVEDDELNQDSEEVIDGGGKGKSSSSSGGGGNGGGRSRDGKHAISVMELIITKMMIPHLGGLVATEWDCIKDKGRTQELQVSELIKLGRIRNEQKIRGEEDGSEQAAAETKKDLVGEANTQDNVDGQEGMNTVESTDSMVHAGTSSTLSKGKSVGLLEAVTGVVAVVLYHQVKRKVIDDSTSRVIQTPTNKPMMLGESESESALHDLLTSVASKLRDEVEALCSIPILVPSSKAVSSTTQSSSSSNLTDRLSQWRFVSSLTRRACALLERIIEWRHTLSVGDYSDDICMWTDLAWWSRRSKGGDKSVDQGKTSFMKGDGRNSSSSNSRDSIKNSRLSSSSPQSYDALLLKPVSLSPYSIGRSYFNSTAFDDWCCETGSYSSTFTSSASTSLPSSHSTSHQQSIFAQLLPAHAHVTSQLLAATILRSSLLPLIYQLSCICSPPTSNMSVQGQIQDPSNHVDKHLARSILSFILSDLLRLLPQDWTNLGASVPFGGPLYSSSIHNMELSSVKSQSVVNKQVTSSMKAQKAATPGKVSSLSSPMTRNPSSIYSSRLHCASGQVKPNLFSRLYGILTPFMGKEDSITEEAIGGAISANEAQVNALTQGVQEILSLLA